MVVCVDHKPLLGILNNRDLASISNPRLQNLKENTLAWNFNIVYNPGKWHRGPDSVSRYPAASELSVDKNFLSMPYMHPMKIKSQIMIRIIVYKPSVQNPYMTYQTVL